MEFAVNVPINPNSFGQVSTALLRELFKKGIDPPLFPSEGSISLDSQNTSKDFKEWLNKCVRKGFLHSRENPCFKLWHLNGSLESFSEKQLLLTFHETDSLTREEVNAAKNNVILVTNNYTSEVFRAQGLNADVVPLGFDHENFKIKNKKYFDDDRITFNLCGKFEKRKHHKKIIEAWIKKYGNDRNYYLQCAVWNNFFSQEENKNNFKSCLGGENYFNVQFLSYIPKNDLYNDFLNSGDIVIGMSGGEGWGLPEFQSVALGKYAVILNAHAYKDWANPSNATLVEPSGKMDSHDGKFFKKGGVFNQGEIFDWQEDDFIDACEMAIKKFKLNPKNENGIKLQGEYSYEKTVDQILKKLNDIS